MSIEASSENIKKNSELILSISKLLQEIINENKDTQKKKLEQQGNYLTYIDKNKSVFNSKKIPGISIQAYLERIVKYSKLEESTLIVALIYIDRLCDSNGLMLSDMNIHR
jgi:hypothetical protein